MQSTGAYTLEMNLISPSVLAFLLVLPSALAAQEAPSAATIMARVAANQNASEAERDHYVYIQHARVTSHKGSKIMCEEVTNARVTPVDKRSQQQLLKLDGRYLLKGKYVTYTKLPEFAKKRDTSGDGDVSISVGDEDSDRNLVENMRQNLFNDKSKDGIGAGLFPLTSKVQAQEDFHLAGRERMNGRDVFHITFMPKDKADFGWKGDAYIDSTAFQPVLVRTKMSRSVPFAVRTLLGTNVPGLGFTVIYAPQGDGVWFPVSFGTEFKIKLFFFYSREITIAAENRSFEKTHVTSNIVEAGTEAPATATPK